jgi:PAS domain S-box-containing protein
MPAKSIVPIEDKPLELEKMLAMNEALVLGALRQHELTEAAEEMNTQLHAEITDRMQVEAALRASDQRFRALFELGPVAVYSCDREGLIREYNNRAAELWGRAPAIGDIGGRFCGSFKMSRPDGSFVAHDQCPMADVLSGKIPEATDIEILLERPDGSQVTVVVNIRPLKDDYGIINGAINCFYDITERKRAEQQLAEKARLIDLSNDAIIVRDLNDKIRLWNKGAEKLFGWTFEEVIGEDLHSFLQTEFPKPKEEIIAQLHREGRFNGEVVQVARDGRRVRSLCGWVLDRSTESIFTSYTDITDRKQIEEELRQAHTLLARHADQLESIVAERTEQLMATNDQLEAFVYTIAHDLRAPLRSMNGFSSVLMDEESAELSPKRHDYARRINKSARFMDAMLNDLLAFSRISQEHLDLASVELEPLVQEIRSRMEIDLRESKGRLEINGPWPSVLAHGPTLEQVLFNLVSNGLKFARPNTPPLIRIWAEDVNVSDQMKPISSAGNKLAGNKSRAPAPASPKLSVEDKDPSAQPEGSPSIPYVRIWVEDNGIGIAQQYQEQIFRVFIRLESSRYQGTGIGLAIVQKGVERMGGRVGLESTPGQGSRFWFDLRKS